MKVNKKSLQQIFFCQKLKSSVPFIQIKPILGIFLRGLSLSSCPQKSESPLAAIYLAPKSHVSF
jgi:hypothetical protein